MIINKSLILSSIAHSSIFVETFFRNSGFQQQTEHTVPHIWSRYDMRAFMFWINWAIWYIDMSFFETNSFDSY